MERGNYRSIHTVIVDGPDFQALSPGAKLVWYTLKMTLGPSGIDVVPALVATLVERTGASVSQCEKGLAQLVERGWVQVDRNVVWMVDGLRHDPHIRLSNQNHRAKVASHINGLPRLPIIDLFRTYYGLSQPPAEIPSTGPIAHVDDALDMPSENPSKMASKSPSPNREREEGKGKGRRKREEGSSAADAAGTKGRAGKPTWLTPFAEAWRAKYGGEMSAGRAVQSLSRLVEQQGTDEVLRRWAIYLDATAAEYANAPKFASTWGRWAKPVLRRSDSAPTGAPSAADQARVEAGQIVAEIRALAYDQAIPGQGSRRLLRLADIEAMGPDIATAVRNAGGVARLLKLETDASDIPFYIRDFAAHLYAARHPNTGHPPEAQSA